MKIIKAFSVLGLLFALALISSVVTADEKSKEENTAVVDGATKETNPVTGDAAEQGSTADVNYPDRYGWGGRGGGWGGGRGGGGWGGGRGGGGWGGGRGGGGWGGGRGGGGWGGGSEEAEVNPDGYGYGGGGWGGRGGGWGGRGGGWGGGGW